MILFAIFVLVMWLAYVIGEYGYDRGWWMTDCASCIACRHSHDGACCKCGRDLGRAGS